MFPGILMFSQDVQHPFPTMLSCIWGAHIRIIWPEISSALKTFKMQTLSVLFYDGETKEI